MEECSGNVSMPGLVTAPVQAAQMEDLLLFTQKLKTLLDNGLITPG
ncbi:MAG: hypothetical protein IPH36_19685 [Saprospiraceae bacterium]|nr:hypothetical protein [Saprospiraceae bacterium]